MNIAIIGAGGIGSYYAGLMSRAGHSVRLVARGEHLKAMQANGLEVKTPNETFVTRPDAIPEHGDLSGSEYVIVAVKSYSLGEIAADVARAAANGAAIVPLLNGVDVAERLEAHGVPRTSIIGGLIAASLFRTAPGKVERRSAFDRMVLGELDDVKRDRAGKLVKAFADVGVAARESDNMPLDLWRKFAFIVPMNVASGLTRGPMGDMLGTEDGRQLIVDTLHEIVLVSRAAGTALSDEDEAKIRKDLLSLDPSTRPSFLADLERRGPTELDLLAGAVRRMGREYGIPTPVHDVAVTAFAAATSGGSPTQSV